LGIMASVRQPGMIFFTAVLLLHAGNAGHLRAHDLETEIMSDRPAGDFRDGGRRKSSPPAAVSRGRFLHLALCDRLVVLEQLESEGRRSPFTSQAPGIGSRSKTALIYQAIRDWCPTSSWTGPRLGVVVQCSYGRSRTLTGGTDFWIETASSRCRNRQSPTSFRAIPFMPHPRRDQEITRFQALHEEARWCHWRICASSSATSIPTLGRGTPVYHHMWRESGVAQRFDDKGAAGSQILCSRNSRTRSVETHAGRFPPPIIGVRDRSVSLQD
jgi:hypothetical protein